MRSSAHWVWSLVLAVGCAQPVPGSASDDLSGRGSRNSDLGSHLGGNADLHDEDLSQLPSLGCNPGFHMCGSTCIPTASCCTDSDCPVYTNSTATCTAGSCTYSCESGFNTCNGTCRGSTLCCVASDCPALPHTTGPGCSTDGQCTFAACQAGYLDFNMVASDGCECQNLDTAPNCAAATTVINVAQGATKPIVGNVPVTGAASWISVTFAGSGTPSYHPHIRLTTNPGSKFVFDVFADCLNTTQACGTETNTNATGVTDWEVANTAGASNGTTYKSVAAVGSSGNVKVEVRRTSGNATCDSYTLTISD